MPDNDFFGHAGTDSPIEIIPTRYHAAVMFAPTAPAPNSPHHNTQKWYQERVYRLEEETGYDPSNQLAAFAKAQEWGDKIPIGVIYRKERATFEEQLPALAKGPLVKQKVEPRRIGKLIAEFM